MGGGWGESGRDGLVLFSGQVFLFAPGVKDPFGETPLQDLGCLFLFYQTLCLCLSNNSEGEGAIWQIVSLPALGPNGTIRLRKIVFSAHFYITFPKGLT